MSDVSVNYFVEHHGKSPVDAHFGTISRTLNSITFVEDISTITQLQDKLQKRFDEFEGETKFIIYHGKKRSNISKIELRDQHSGRKIVLRDYYSIHISCSDLRIVYACLISADKNNQHLAIYKIIEMKDNRVDKTSPPNSIRSQQEIQVHFLITSTNASIVKDQAFSNRKGIKFLVTFLLNKKSSKSLQI